MSLPRLDGLLASARSGDGGEAPRGATQSPEVWRARFASGDRRAFAELVRVHAVRVRALLVRLVTSRDDADDLLQEVFVRAWRRREQFDARGSVEGWLLRIAVNLARDHVRSRPRPADALDPERDAAPGGGPEGAASGRELAAALRVALQRLPHRLRAALVLRVIEERPYEEVARILDLAPGTVRIQVMKARRRLATELAPWLEEERP